MPAKPRLLVDVDNVIAASDPLFRRLIFMVTAGRVDLDHSWALVIAGLASYAAGTAGLAGLLRNKDLTTLLAAAGCAAILAAGGKLGLDLGLWWMGRQ